LLPGKSVYLQCHPHLPIYYVFHVCFYKSGISRRLLKSNRNRKLLVFRSITAVYANPPSVLNKRTVRLRLVTIKANPCNHGEAQAQLPRFFCWLAGSFPERIEIKTILSMPKIISRTIRVSNEIHTSGVVKKSIFIYLIRRTYKKQMFLKSSLINIGWQLFDLRLITLF